ncbi:hypothetical protein ABTZ58_32390 [Streptomyces sp. NPDC094143]|uniref:hypothetical protein n=1 Tax=Streptomyces sp. NPDC094143 TaxID=3155310 RepID=UPI0033289923
MSSQARRLLTSAHLALVAAVSIVYMTDPVVAPAMWAVMGLSGACALLIGTHVYRPAHRWPWWVLAAGLLTFIAGDTYYFVMEEHLGASNPFPSPADACYLAMYPLFATQQRAISITHPLGDILVLALLARLLTPSPVDGSDRAVRLLVLGTVTSLATDIAYGIRFPLRMKG